MPTSRIRQIRPISGGCYGYPKSEGVGLTDLYNSLDEGAYSKLQALHRSLDEAVAECYGWPKKSSQDTEFLVSHLLELNKEISSGRREYAPF